MSINNNQTAYCPRHSANTGVNNHTHSASSSPHSLIVIITCPGLQWPWSLIQALPFSPDPCLYHHHRPVYLSPEFPPVHRLCHFWFCLSVSSSVRSRHVYQHLPEFLCTCLWGMIYSQFVFTCKLFFWSLLEKGAHDISWNPVRVKILSK